MLASFLILAAATALVAAYAARTQPGAIAGAWEFMQTEGIRIAIRLPFALIAAACVAELMPDRAIATILGADTGFAGIAAAAVLGGFLPGGPIVSFPLAILLAREGAGGPQVIALVTGWSVYAFHRVMAYEGPIMGWRFALLRLATSWFVPPLVGVAAGVIASALGLSLALR